MITRCTIIIFIQLPPSTSQILRGETLFLIPLIITRKYSKTFLPANLSLPQINNILAIFKDFPTAAISSSDHQQPSTAATSKSNQQQPSTAATSKSKQQQQPATAVSIRPTSSSYTINTDLL